MKNNRLLQFCLVGIVCMVIGTGSTIAYFKCKEKEQVSTQAEYEVDSDENMDSACITSIEDVVEESEDTQKEETKEVQEKVSKEQSLQKAKANTTKDKNITRPVDENTDIKSENQETTGTVADTTVEMTTAPSSDTTVGMTSGSNSGTAVEMTSGSNSDTAVEMTSDSSSDASDMSNNNEVQNAPEQPVQPSATTSTTTDATTGDSSQPVKAYNPNDIPDKLPPTEFSQEWHDMWLDINDPSQWDAVVQDVMDNITEKYPPVENNQ